MALQLADWKCQRQRHDNEKVTVTVTEPPPPARTAQQEPPEPPKYTLWIEAAPDDPEACDLLSTAENLHDAITRATSYARSLSSLILILETHTGKGWAIQSINAGESIPPTFRRR